MPPTPRVSCYYPPPPTLPDGTRYVGGWLPRLTVWQKAPGTLTVRKSQRPRAHRIEAMLEVLQTAKTLHWTLAVTTLTTHTVARYIPPLPLHPPVALRPLAYVFDACLKHHTVRWAQVLPVISRWHPLAVLTLGVPPPALLTHTDHVWRIRTCLPAGPTSAFPHLYALSLPDPQALGDPRLHAWLVPPLTPTDPDLTAWREVLAARPEVPVLFVGPWQDWTSRLITWSCVADVLYKGHSRIPATQIGKIPPVETLPR